MTRHGLDSSVFPGFQGQPGQPQEHFPFRVIRQLGEGGMARVYLAQDEAGRMVALKLLHNHASRTQAERLVREGRLVATLSHPNVVGLISSGTFGGRPYLAYELVKDAKELDEAFEDRTLIERVELLTEVARGVAHAHAKGVVHRDLKPANILVDKGGRARVADFGIGLSDDLEKMTKTGALIGTPHWMAPEQIRGERDLQGACSDVWALGVMLYEALTGVLPFEGDSLVQVSAGIVHESPPSPRAIHPEIPPRIEAVCLRALQKDPAARFPTALEFADALSGALSGPPPRSGRRLLRLGVLLFVIPIGLWGAWLALPNSDPIAPVETPAPSVAAPSPSERAPLTTPAKDLEAALGLEESDPDRARALAKRVLQGDPRSAAAWLLLGNLDLQTAPEEAIRSYRRSIELAPSAEAYVGLGFATHRMGKSLEGLKEIAKAIEIDPRCALAHRRLALIQYEREHNERALSSVNFALTIEPKSPGAWNTKGLVLKELGKLAEAEESLRKSIELDRDPSILRNLAVVRAARSDLRGALRNMSEAIELEPDSAELWIALGIIQINAKDNEAAIHALDRALRLDPSASEAYFYRGLARSRAKLPAAALEDFEEFLQRGEGAGPLRKEARKRIGQLRGERR